MLGRITERRLQNLMIGAGASVLFVSWAVGIIYLLSENKMEDALFTAGIGAFVLVVVGIFWKDS